MSFPYQGYGLGPGFPGAWGPGVSRALGRGLGPEVGSSGARSQVCRSVSGPIRRPAPSLGWPGERKSIASVVSLSRLPRSLGPRAWGRGLQGFGASRALGPGPPGLWGLQGLGVRAPKLGLAPPPRVSRL